MICPDHSKNNHKTSKKYIYLFNQNKTYKKSTSYIFLIHNFPFVCFIILKQG